MAIDGVRLVGITEVGHVEAGPTDVPWGNTQQDGVTLALSPNTVDLMSAQAKVMEDVNLLEAAMELQVNLVEASLQAIQRAYGIPDASFAGDLAAGSPTEEVLAVGEGDLGSTERQMYVLTPGPSSTRRVDVPRSKVSSLGDIQMGSNAYQLPSATWQVLNPTDGSDPLTITDAT